MCLVCICATHIEKNAMYCNLIYLFCHVLEEMIESTLFVILDVFCCLEHARCAGQ